MYKVVGTPGRIDNDRAELQGRDTGFAHYSVEICDHVEFEYNEYVVALDTNTGKLSSAETVGSCVMSAEQEAANVAIAAAVALWEKGE